MAISSELMYAILAMDAYNRGYNAGITDDGPNDSDGLGGQGSQIGNATVLVDDVSPEVQAAGFYAVAYEWDGESAGCRHGSRATFVSAKVAKTKLALAWPVGCPARFARLRLRANSLGSDNARLVSGVGCTAWPRQ